MTTEPEKKVGVCWECGYSLRGLETPRCPECGRPFDPADEATMNMGWEVRRVTQWLMKPPSWPTYLLTASAALMSVWAAASPMPRRYFTDFLMLWIYTGEVPQFRFLFRDFQDPRCRFLMGAMLWLAVAAIWIARRVARGITVKCLSNQKAAPFAYWRRWLVTPVIFGMTLGVCWSSVPLRVGFLISKPWLKRAADNARPGPTPASALTPGWMGIYPPAPYTPPVPPVQWEGPQAMVSVSPAGYFVYRADGQLPKTFSFNETYHGHEITHLYGPWFVVVRSPYVP